MSGERAKSATTVPKCEAASTHTYALLSPCSLFTLHCGSQHSCYMLGRCRVLIAPPAGAFSRLELILLPLLPLLFGCLHLFLCSLFPSPYACHVLSHTCYHREVAAYRVGHTYPPPFLAPLSHFAPTLPWLSQSVIFPPPWQTTHSASPPFHFFSTFAEPVRHQP